MINQAITGSIFVSLQFHTALRELSSNTFMLLPKRKGVVVKLCFE